MRYTSVYMSSSNHTTPSLGVHLQDHALWLLNNLSHTHTHTRSQSKDQVYRQTDKTDRGIRYVARSPGRRSQDVCRSMLFDVRRSTCHIIICIRAHRVIARHAYPSNNALLIECCVPSQDTHGAP